MPAVVIVGRRGLAVLMPRTVADVSEAVSLALSSVVGFLTRGGPPLLPEPDGPVADVGAAPPPFVALPACDCELFQLTRAAG